MAHISRKELKKDEFQDTLARGAEILTTHRRLILQVAVAVAVVVGAFFAWRHYSSRQDALASTAFSAAMQIYQGQVAAPGQPPPPGVLTFPNDTVKYTAADAAMGQVAMHFAHSRYGSMARYYAAVSLDHMRRYQDAVNWLVPMTHGGDPQLRALAKFELAHVYDQMGKASQAVALYRQLESKPTIFVPKPLVLLALGDHYRSQNDTQQAVKYYERVKSEFPNTGLADQADQRLEMLGKS